MIELLNMDCMDYMATCPDKAFDLAIVDPPYGIGRDGSYESTGSHGGRKAYEFKGWDNSAPNQDYFSELFRITKNQIIWGGNYFTQYLPSSMGWIFWDKGQRICNSDGELAFTSFQQALRCVHINRTKIGQDGGCLHPTQKPIYLYNWILRHYAKEGDRIIDTHLGSGSSAISALRRGFDFVGIELDPDYFKAAQKRFNEQSAQMPIFPFNNE